ncbi:MAG TPA: ChbG/HpnK family deacetylase [Candidatus Sulfotelmatobacter sp.]|jgi:predicted glycoside hydrolase/deacetylase ChbG (UPF0249 family)|nr:ChbG/HpnK family deacetylase [Candidatus Sulfotelmatobacter sp.]
MTKTKVPPRFLIVCADDYGISPAVSAGIRELAAAGRITATGAMTCMSSWALEAPALRGLSERLGERLEIGLHVTLTDQQPLGEMPVFAPEGRLPPIGALIKASLLRLLPSLEIAEEIERQLSAFEAHFGRAPDFIDGHQHVHLLPGIRQLAMGLFHRRLDPARCWLRDCSDCLPSLLARGGMFKASVVSALLARGFSRQAQERGIVTNRGFTGFYDPVAAPLAERMPSMLRGLRNGSLLMVHPGHVDSSLEAVDSLIRPRQSEWDYLSSDAWPELLARRGLDMAGRGMLFSH